MGQSDLCVRSTSVTVPVMFRLRRVLFRARNVTVQGSSELGNVMVPGTFRAWSSVRGMFRAPNVKSSECYGPRDVQRTELGPVRGTFRARSEGRLELSPRDFRGWECYGRSDVTVRGTFRGWSVAARSEGCSQVGVLQSGPRDVWRLECCRDTFRGWSVATGPRDVQRLECYGPRDVQRLQCYSKPIHASVVCVGSVAVPRLDLSFSV